MASVLGALPLLGLILWWWNEIRYAFPQKIRLSGSGAKLPPGHMGFPFFGEMLSFLWYFKILRRADDFVNSKRRKYGDGVGLYRTHLFGSPSIIACFPAVTKYVLQTPSKFILNWPTKPLMGYSALVSVQGEAHSRLRSYVVGAINQPDALRRIADHVQPRMVAALNSWAQKGQISAYKEIKKVTFENIGELFVSFEAGPKLEAMANLFAALVKGVRAQPWNVPGTAYHKAFQSRKKLEEIFWGELEKKKKNHENGVMENDLMDGLMQMRDADGNKLDDQEVVDNIVSLVVGGFESTTLALTWAIYLLAKNPDVLEKLREENMAFPKNMKGDFLAHEDISKLKYTNKVVEETIRIANIAFILFRTALEEVEYRGYKIPKNWNVIVWIRYLHTNPENFEDPMCFNPDRWDGPAKPGTYQVFGGGPRICAGNMLARVQVALLLHHLSTGYKWELVNPDAGFLYLPHHAPADGAEIRFSKI